jgi:hypothetical protein
MSNTITGLIPTIYSSLDKVSRELVGFIPAVALNASASRAALNQTIRIPVTRKSGASQSFTPAMAFPNAAYQTIDYVDMTVSKSLYQPISWSGEQYRSITQPEGSGGASILQNQITHAMRALVNDIEADLALSHLAASNAYDGGEFATAGDLSDSAQIRRVLEANGCPSTDLHLVLGSNAVANMRGKQSVLFKVNESGTDDMLRRGIIGSLHGFNIHESAQVKTHAAGTANGATTNADGYDVGDTVITLASAGTGTILAGDAITFAGDPNVYIVVSGDANVADGGTITLAAPGLKVAIGEVATAITVLDRAAYSTRNLAFDRDAIQLIARAPAMPDEGDMAADSEIVVDPMTGLAFDFRLYKGRGMNTLEIHIAYGIKVIKPEHLAVLLG